MFSFNNYQHKTNYQSGLVSFVLLLWRTWRRLRLCNIIENVYYFSNKKMYSCTIISVIYKIY